MSPTRSEIEKMLAERLDFLIGVGGDMRSPLTGIAGFAAVLAELDSVAADPTASEAVAYIRKEAQRLVELLNQLLDFGQVEQGGPDLDREPIDLVRMARQAVEPWAARHPHVKFELVHHGDVMVEGDFLKLHRVLANLLDNAVRHSPEGGVITVDVDGDDSEAVLSVSDEGGGVPVADRNRVFERFVRLPSKGKPDTGGGIGLYVVRGLVEAHGGSVSVEDGPNNVGPERGGQVVEGPHNNRPDSDRPDSDRPDSDRPDNDEPTNRDGGSAESGARFVVRLPVRPETESRGHPSVTPPGNATDTHPKPTDRPSNFPG